VRFDGAVIKEQGVTFGVIIVKRSVLNSPTHRAEMQTFGQLAWGPMPIVLMAQDGRGTPTYQGRRDLVDFLANVDYRRIPWKHWTN
jgi:hypothetical protein